MRHTFSPVRTAWDCGCVVQVSLIWRQLERAVAAQTYSALILLVARDRFLKGLPAQMADAYGDVEALCHIIQQRCVGSYQQFDDFRSCYKYMSLRPKYKMGYCPLLAGDTLACRWTHAILTDEAMRPDVHCFHMGPHNPDPDGKLKCHDLECGYERSGPILCGTDTCDGEYMHAGKLVDYMHSVFWFTLCFISVSAALGIHLKRGKILHALASRRVQHKNKETSDANHQVLLEGLTSLNRAFPVLLGMSLVFFFEGFIFALCATMREDIAFLWRPWPINAILPRFNERHSASAEFKTDLSFATYFGQNDEPVFSQFNQ